MGPSYWPMNRRQGVDSVAVSGASATGLDLTVSVLLRFEHLKATDQFSLAKLAALAVHDVVSEAMKVAVDRGGERIRIKWPNDVLIDRRKVSGILIQNELTGDRVAW